eukprot:jgi/Tetstr1/426807/TSEL_017022.t1
MAVCRAAVMLEFYLQIFFAIFPALAAEGALPAAVAHSSPVRVREELAMRMRGFKAYLETRGAELARTGEFLPYYALPYVGAPAEHPSFKELFGGGWARELRTQLDLFLQTIPSEVAKPRMYAMHAASRMELAGMMGGARGVGDRPVSALLCGENEMADLVGAARPASAAATPPPATKPLPALPSFPQAAGSPSPPRPGGNSPPAPPQSNATPPIRTSASASLGASLRDLPGVLRASMALDAAGGAPPQRSTFQQAILPPLNYGAVRRDLMKADNDTVATLLQALRWRISKSPAGNDRLRVILTLVERDVLLCTDPPRGGASAVVAVAQRCDGPASEELARLLSCMASTAAGRAYLLQPGAGAVATLVQLLTAIPEMDTLNAPMILAHEGVGNISADSLLQQHALGALQKLSLLRVAQSEMIARGVIGVIVELLAGELAGLSEYTVEYSMALLMNLSLRSAGRQRFEQCDVLAVLDALIESSNPQVRTYVNGTLYSVLQRSAIRSAARERGLGDFLQMVAANSEEVFARQIRYIQVQLGSSAPDHAGPPSGDEEEFEDVDEEGEELGDEEVEDWEPEEALNQGGLTGEEFLCERYLADAPSALAEEEMLRESMAVATAQANMVKHMQGGSLSGSLRAGAVAASMMGGEMLQRPTTPASFGASLRGGGGLHAVAEAVEEPSPRRASRVPSSHGGAKAPLPSRPGSSLSTSSASRPPGSAGGQLAPIRQPGSRGGSRPGSASSGGMRPPGGAASRTSEDRARAEREAAALQAKIAEKRRDDPVGLSAAPSADEYLQAFGAKSSIPRTPSSR